MSKDLEDEDAEEEQKPDTVEEESKTEAP